MVDARIELAPIIGRAIGHQQKFRSCFLQRLGDIRVPCVFANRAADAGIADRIWPPQRTGIKNPNFVKHSFVRQMVLQHPRGDFPALANKIGVEQLRALSPRTANRQRWAICALQRQCLDRLHGSSMKRGLHHQILGIVASDEHFGQGHQIRTRVASCLPGRARFGGIAYNITNCWVQLPQRDAKCVCHAGAP